MMSRSSVAGALPDPDPWLMLFCCAIIIEPWFMSKAVCPAPQSLQVAPRRRCIRVRCGAPNPRIMIINSNANTSANNYNNTNNNNNNIHNIHNVDNDNENENENDPRGALSPCRRPDPPWCPPRTSGPENESWRTASRWQHAACSDIIDIICHVYTRVYTYIYIYIYIYVTDVIALIAIIYRYVYVYIYIYIYRYIS